MAFDYSRKAAEQPRDEFVASCPFPFLVGASKLVQPQAPLRTGRFPKVVTGPFGGERDRTAVTNIEEEERRANGRLVVVPVRKVHDLFPHMITVGRTRNNDVVLEDVLISKFHAFFRQKAGGNWELCDAGSANGTRVGDVALPAKGAGVALPFGARVGFAQLEFQFLDAGACWDALRAGSDPTSHE